MNKLIIGIDFGTSTTVVRYRLLDDDQNNDQIRIQHIYDKGGGSCIPTVIFRTNGNNYYGSEAEKRQRSGQKGDYFSVFKMMLVDGRDNVKKEGQKHTVDFLGFVYSLFVEQTRGLNYDKMDIYISYPAKWPPDCVNFMKRAVLQAGFQGSIFGVNEPKAASYNFLHKYLSDIQSHRVMSRDTPIHVMMLDMGAGTSDIVIFQLGINDKQELVLNNMLSYPPIGADTLCGGREIDRLLSTWMKEYLMENAKQSQERCDSLFDFVEAKKWKDDYMSEVLRDNEEIDSMPNPIPLAIAGTENGDTAIESFRFNRQIFEKITKSHWESLYSMIIDSMSKYKELFHIGAEDIDLLFLTGGHSQWYLVSDFFKGVFPENIWNNEAKMLDFKKLKAEEWRILQDALAQESVATGLCLQNNNIHISETYPNNVWTHFAVNNKECDIEQVVHSGQSIPQIISNEQELILQKFDLFSNLHFNITLNIYIGDTIERSQHYRYRFSHNAGGFGRRLIEFILFFFNPFSSPDTIYRFTLATNVNIQSDGMIDISGVVKIDDFLKSKTLSFTMEDLEEITPESVQI